VKAVACGLVLAGSLLVFPPKGRCQACADRVGRRAGSTPGDLGSRARDTTSQRWDDLSARGDRRSLDSDTITLLEDTVSPLGDVGSPQGDALSLGGDLGSPRGDGASVDAHRPAARYDHARSASVFLIIVTAPALACSSPKPSSKRTAGRSMSRAVSASVPSSRRHGRPPRRHARGLRERVNSARCVRPCIANSREARWPATCSSWGV